MPVGLTRVCIAASIAAYATAALAQPPAPTQPAPVDGTVAVGVDATAVANATGSIQLEPSFPLNIEYGLDFGFGAVEGAVPMQGFAFVASLPVNVYVLPWLAFGVRGNLTRSPDEAIDGPMRAGHVDDVDTPAYAAWSIAGGPRIRIWSNDRLHRGAANSIWAHRLAWVFDADAGYVYINDHLGDPGPLARLSIGRELLITDATGNGLNVGFAFSGEKGFAGADAHRALLFTMWFHGRAGAVPPRGLREIPDRTVWPSTFGIDTTLFLGDNIGSLDASTVTGLALSYGVPVTDLVEPLVRADVLDLMHFDDTGGKYHSTMLGGSAGLRFRLNHWAPWMVDVLGGYEHAYGVLPLAIGSGPFVDVGTGFHIVDCVSGRWGLDLGVRSRIGLGDGNSRLASLGLVLGFIRGSSDFATGHSTCPRKHT